MARSQAVHIPVGQVTLDADLATPATRRGIVVFAHGSGSGRKSPRNREVAHRLQEHGFGTLLLDLLAAAEVPVDELTGEYRFNIELLSERLVAATDWLVRQPGCEKLLLGYFGASTGGAVAMVGAAQRPNLVAAIVLRGARTDLGDRVASQIRCPTLVLVGGADPSILHLNRRTLQLLSCVRELAVIPGATHLFEEPGALDRVADLAVSWFERHLRQRDGYVARSPPTLAAIGTGPERARNQVRMKCGASQGNSKVISTRPATLRPFFQ